MKRLEIRIFGLVQGVGFRNFVQRKAESFFLKGFVRNLSDGSVEIVAEGKENDLEEFLQAISKGPMFANVSTIETKQSAASGLFIGFETR
jgi:acylphosphatase